MGIRPWIRAHWPRLRLRTIVFATLFIVAALPGIAAMFLRVYENTLVRQTEGELVAQGAALAAIAAADWPGAPPPRIPRTGFRPELPRIDLSRSAVLPARPTPVPAAPADKSATMAAATLAPVFAQTSSVTLAAILLLDSQGRIAAPGARASLAALPEVRAALNGRLATVLRLTRAERAAYRLEWLSRAAAVRLHHARPVVVDGRVVGVLLLSRQARNLFRGLYADRGKIALGVAAILALLIVLSGVLSRAIVRPVEALGRATRALGTAEESIPEPPRTAAVEIQGLYTDFARMADAIERRSRYLRDFAHAVSHEFKTPLSGIRGALEILSDHGDDMSPDERARFLANADADAARLTLLATRLLELARADLGTGGSGDSGDLRDVLLRLTDAQNRATFTVAVDCEACPRLVAMAEVSLDAVISALIENSRQAGARSIAFRAGVQGGAVHLIAQDDGPGIPEADRDRVFEPFFTTRRTSGGSGLGLPIVRSLIEAAGGTLTLMESADGACFRIVLPLT
ncbi:HAMP domain-containing sensor histidine kinase [Croceicoccus sp. YJ47]|uniref:sensor histidine kinase n=1 Tax=Croceicoccus sp. YJ47 TaxID=2798724 RepID=UPI0019203F05|nr:HAMP domain-containing sensor histidine kinase [Croceicoccus sp. YJ47]QQN74255.1 HAMP domain-containing histidine kinase [Croceicoccus sp. YJ47]